MQRAWFLALVLLIPSASAADLHLHLPEEGSALAPVLGGYTLGEGPFEGHVDITMQFWLDGYLILETGSIHEHDGVHTFAFTPPADGDLRVLALRGDEVAAEQILPIAPAGAQVPVAPTVTGFDWWWQFQGGDQSRTLVELMGPDNTLRVSSWIDATEPLFFGENQFSQGDGWVAAADATQRGGFPLDPFQLRSNGSPSAQTGYTGIPDCTHEMVLDPVGQTNGIPTMQLGSTIRATAHGQSGTLGYFLITDPVGGEVDATTRLYVTAQGPLYPAQIRAHAPGLHTLYLVPGIDNDPICQTQVLVTQGTVGGNMETRLDPNGSGMDLTFTALDDGGARLGHYEYETRIYRDADPANSSLVWMGKLHGHAGPATVRLHNLPEGDYRAVVYPSPQSLDALTVPGRFESSFHIEHKDLDADIASGDLPTWAGHVDPDSLQAPDDGKESPGLTLILVGVLLGALAWSRRH